MSAEAGGWMGMDPHSDYPPRSTTQQCHNFINEEPPILLPAPPPPASITLPTDKLKNKKKQKRVTTTRGDSDPCGWGGVNIPNTVAAIVCEVNKNAPWVHLGCHHRQRPSNHHHLRGSGWRLVPPIWSHLPRPPPTLSTLQTPPLRNAPLSRTLGAFPKRRRALTDPPLLPP